MDAAAAVARIARFQANFKAIAALALTAYMFPKQATVTHMQQFDYIVIGGGSAGAVVAARLAEAKLKVLLVEAGGDPPLESIIPGLLGFLRHSQYDWDYYHEKKGYCFQCYQNKTVVLAGGRLLGGGSAINHMIYVRGCPTDFIPWQAAAKDNTWGWDEVLPFFIKSENLQDEEIINSPQGKYHGTKGFLGVTRQSTEVAKKVLKSFEEVGKQLILDINADSHLGYGQPMLTIRDGVRQSTAYTILGAQKNNSYLHVLKEAVVNKIIFDKSNNAIGILVTTKNNKQIELRARKEVIVSAGAINTPQLLMLSGIGPRSHLQSLNIPVRSNLPVGMNLQDHVAVMISIKLENSTEPPAVPDPRTYFDSIVGYVSLNDSQMCPDYQSVNSINPKDSTAFLEFCSFIFGYDYDICQKAYEAGKGRKTLQSSVFLLHPKSRGRVFLQSTNPNHPPLVDVGYFTDARDLKKIVDSLIDFVKILSTRRFRSINAEMVDFELPACKGLKYWSRRWWRCYARCMMFAAYHFGGSCSLGTVVDSHLRVFGVGRLRIADNSIMPELVSGNTNAVAIMIGEKAAEFIKRDTLRCN